MDPIAPVTNQPKSNDSPPAQSSKYKQFGETSSCEKHHHPKWDFVNNKHNIGKNWCDNLWWLIISVIIFGMGAYVRYDVIKYMIVIRIISRKLKIL